jgi:hypothetical protein
MIIFAESACFLNFSSICGCPELQISVYRAVGKADNAKCRMQNAE